MSTLIQNRSVLRQTKGGVLGKEGWGAKDYFLDINFIIERSICYG
jgi:hypothetical protein